MNKKKLQALITDFKQYAFILLAVSVFLYLGVLLPDQGKAEIYDFLLMITTIIFLAVAFICFRTSLKYQKELDQLEEN